MDEWATCKLDIRPILKFPGSILSYFISMISLSQISEVQSGQSGETDQKDWFHFLTSSYLSFSNSFQIICVFTFVAFGHCRLNSSASQACDLKETAPYFIWSYFHVIQIFLDHGWVYLIVTYLKIKQVEYILEYWFRK